MARSELIDAFNDCVERLHAGQSIDDCLRRYPHLADVLRPMLHTGQAVQRSAPGLSPAARVRMRARVLQHAPAAVVPSPARRVHFRGVTLLAAALLMVLCGGVLFAMLQRDGDDNGLTVETLTLHPSATAAATATTTATATGTATATATVTVTPIPAPSQTPRATPAASLTPASSPLAAAPEQCMFTLDVSSANLRSGPGTGYTVIGFAYAGDEFVVREINTTGAWVNVTPDGGEVWIALSTGEMDDCPDLPVSDLPLSAGSPAGGDNAGTTGGTGAASGPGSGEAPDGDSRDDTGGDSGDDSGDDPDDDSGDDHSDEFDDDHPETDD